MTGLLLAVETVVLALLALLVIGLLRSHAEILRRLHDLGVDLDGRRAPASRRPADQFNVFPEVPSPGPERRARRPGRDLSGVELDRRRGVRPRRRRPARHARSPSSPAPASPASASGMPSRKPAKLGLAAGRPARGRHEGPRRGEPRRASPTLAPRRHPAGHVVGGVGRLRGARLAVLRAGRRAVRPGPRRGHRHRLAPGAGPARAGRRRRRVRQPARGRRVAKPAADDARERRVDAELLSAGIRPGDPSLYGSPTPSGEATTEPGTGGQ